MSTHVPLEQIKEAADKLRHVGTYFDQKKKNLSDAKQEWQDANLEVIDLVNKAKAAKGGPTKKQETAIDDAKATLQVITNKKEYYQKECDQAKEKWNEAEDALIALRHTFAADKEAEGMSEGEIWSAWNTLTG